MTRRLASDAASVRLAADRRLAAMPRVGRLGAATLLALLVLSVPDRARAACDPDPPSDDDAVVCTGTDETGYDATGATNLTITTSGVVTMDDSSALDAAISLSDGNSVTLGSGATTTVTEAGGAGVRGGDDNFVTNQGSIVVNGAGGVGIDVGSVSVDDRGTPELSDDLDPQPTPEILNDGSITVDAAGGIGIRATNNYDLTNGGSGSITLGAGATGGVGIDGQNDNILSQAGTITVNADNAWATRLGENTGLPLPNGGIFTGTSRTIINGDGSRAMEVGNNTGTSVSGRIDLNGDGTIGVLAGNRSDAAIPANHTQSGTITITGDDAFGLKMGDGWLEFDTNDEPTQGGINQRGRIEVFGARSVGVFAGDETNLAFDHDSFVRNSGILDVTGADAVGISVGGNSRLDRWDLDDPSANVVLFTLDHSGTITGGADAGPLVLFRNFAAGRENRLLNSGTIRADLTNLGTADRAIAVRGSDGDEIFFDSGTIRGDIEFLDGDDRYVVDGAASYEGGTIDGGNGTDEVFLGFTSSGVASFDVGNLAGFERILIDGRDPNSGDAVGWRIENGNTFTGAIEIRANGRLAAPANPDGTTAAVTLAGDLTIDPSASILVAPDGSATVPLTLTSVTPTTLAGTLVVEPTELLTATGTYRLIEITAGRGTSEFATIDAPSTLGLLSLSTAYDATGVDLNVVASATFAGVANTSNRAAIAAYFDALEADGSTQMAIADQIAELRGSSGDLNETFDALDPTGYDAQTQVIAESSRRIANLLFDRPRQCRTGDLDDWSDRNAPLDCHAGRLGAWATAIGTLRERDAHSGQPEYEAEMGGIVLGVDLEPIGDLDLTAALTVQRGRVDVQGVGDSDLVLADLTGVASWREGPLRVQGAASYGYGSHNDRRGFTIDESATVISAGARDDHGSHHIGLSAEAGYLFDLGPVRVEPLAGLDYVWIAQDEISEGDAGIWGLRVEERDDSVLFGSAGVRLGTVYEHSAFIGERLTWMDGVWRPSVDVRWRQLLVGAERELEAGLLGAPDTVGDFTVEGEEDAGGLDVGVGVTFQPKHANRLQLEIRYDLFTGPETLEHDLVAKLRFGF